jgi:4-carboxymuconolactone decarboxylase
MARVPYVTSRDQLPEGRRELFDHIAETRGRAGSAEAVPRSFQTLLNSPDAAEPIAALGEYLRLRCPLDPAIRETAILATARELRSQYEWTHHEPIARSVGVRDEVIQSILSGRAPMGLPAKEGVFVQVAKEQVRNGVVSERTFQAIEHLLGPRLTVDLIVLINYYAMLHRTLASLGTELEPYLEPLMPE